MGTCTTKVPRKKSFQNPAGNSALPAQEAEQNGDNQIQTSCKNGQMESSNTALVSADRYQGDNSNKNSNNPSTINIGINKQGLQSSTNINDQYVQNPNSNNQPSKQDEALLNEILKPSKSQIKDEQSKQPSSEDATQKENEGGSDIQQSRKKHLCFEESDQDSVEEEERKGVTTKGKNKRMSVLDQQSTAHTGLMNDGFSKKEDYQTSETYTTTHKLVKTKKSAIISTHESGIMIKVCCPTQESVLEVLEGEDELKEIPDEPEFDEHDEENLSDENMESVVQKNYYLEKAGEGFMKNHILDLDKRNPCDRLSQNSSRLIVSMTAVV